MKDSKRVVKATWRSCESAESSDSDEGTVRHVYELHNGMHERVTINIEGKPIVDTKSLRFCGTSLDVENFLKDKCVLVSSGNIIHMSKF